MDKHFSDKPSHSMDKVIIVDDVTPPDGKSPSRLYFDFPTAIKKILEGQFVSKKEWEEKGGQGSYGYLADARLCLHKNTDEDGLHHSWMVSEGDMVGTDWFIYE